MENNKQIDSLDFSGLFKLDVLLHFDISTYSFYEIGLKKLFTCTDGKELIFLYIDSQSERYEKKYEWDFVDNPINCFSFEPSGTWLLIVSDQKILLVPYLPLFAPQNHFDCKWSLSSVTVLPFGEIPKPTSVLWWLTKESENVIIIGTKAGSLVFYSLESQSVVGECKVAGEISDLQMCFDDSLDLLALLVTSSKSQQWKLVLEHRSVNYNWLNQIRAQNDKKEGFMSYIKQLSRDKINMLTQGGSKDNNVAPADYTLKPTDYLPTFRKGSNNWSLTAQYVNGKHFLTAFELNEGTLILEDLDTCLREPSTTLKPRITSDGLYIQGLWSQRLVYLLRKNEIEVHSVRFSSVKGDGECTKSESTKLWSAEVIGDVLRGHVMSAREAAPPALGWREPTFVCDLQLPRFTLESCLVVTRSGAYILNTVVDPCEWVVSLVMRGGVGVERAAGALAADTPAIIRASADMLMSRGKIAAAQFLYSLSKSSIDGWVARLGVFGRLHELALYRHTDTALLSSDAICIRTLALLLKMATNPEQKFDMGVNIYSLKREQLIEVTQFIAGVGLWELLPTFTLHQGRPELILDAMKSKPKLCRGALTCLLVNRNIVTTLLEENGRWFLDFIIENCKTFDWRLLKCFGLWMNPLQDQFRPVMRDLRQGIKTPYTAKMLHLITAFTHIVCAIESINPSADIEMNMPQGGKEEGGTWKDQFVPQRSLSCGLRHWAVIDEGNAKLMSTAITINPGLIGRVISVACGRHHTIVLTENGVYASGDNGYGQLGVGRAWGDGQDVGASCAGYLHHVTPSVTWPAPVRQVAAGHYHSAAIDAGGRLYTWGWNVHGQLGLGSCCDQTSPQLVTRLQGRKVESVGCGAAHTVVGMKNGEVWACGASVFGQLGSGGRDKSSVFIRVPLPDPIHTIAVGYFHNLALSQKGVLYEWGASPQMIKAWCPRSALSPPPPTPDPTPDPHLSPRATDLANVPGRILKIAAGWHHSALIDSYGMLFTWGLNFDGQLGSGDRKTVPIPKEAKILSERPCANQEEKSECKVESDTKSIVGCGGDFTIYIDDDGRVYGTGNLRQLNMPTTERENTISRVLTLKTTKRVVKIPASRTGNKYMFQQIDRIDIMFPFDIDDAHRTRLSAINNPLKTMKDYTSNSWLDHIIQQLKPWMDENILENTNIKAKLAFHNNKYVECFKLCLESVSFNATKNELYIVHSKQEQEGKDCRNDDLKIELTNVMSKRIKDISLSILNEEFRPPIDEAIYKKTPCCCDERKYLPGKNIDAHKSIEKNMSAFTANVIDKCMNIFPVDANIWESCFRSAKDYYVENGLEMEELQKVFDKYMNRDVTCMAHAVLYSSDCAHFNQILSPEFYLDMCNRVLDTWV